MSKIDLEARSPENAGLIVDGAIVDIQNEDRFSPNSKFAFNPMTQELLSIDNFLLMLLLKKLSSAQLVDVAKAYMGNITKMLTEITKAGKAHPLTALNASTQFAVVAHRFGVITDSGYLKMADQTRSIVDKLIQINFLNIGLDGLTSLVEGAPDIITSVSKAQAIK